MTPPPSLREVAEALLAAEGESLSIPRRQRVCSYCSGPTNHAENPACPVHLARWVLTAVTFSELPSLSTPAPEPVGDVAGLADECEQAALVADSEYDADLYRRAAAALRGKGWA